MIITIIIIKPCPAHGELGTCRTRLVSPDQHYRVENLTRTSWRKPQFGQNMLLLTVGCSPPFGLVVAEACHIPSNVKCASGNMLQLCAWTAIHMTGLPRCCSKHLQHRQLVSTAAITCASLKMFFLRSMILSLPPGSHVPTSPVCNQPSPSSTS